MIEKGGNQTMIEKFTRLLVTKLSPSTHEKLKEFAREDRRTLSALSRIIIEDYIDGFKSVPEEIRENRYNNNEQRILQKGEK